MTEIWKPIKGYEGKYEVSNKGRVKSLFGRVRPLKEPRILKPSKFNKSQTTYEQVELSNPTVYFLVHRLVAEHFIDNPGNKPNVNHIDNNGLNNNITNLEWCTQSENLLHAQQQGRLTNAQQKGGITTSTNNRNKSLQEADALLGTYKGTWQVIKNLGFCPIGNKGLNRIRLLCKCDCGMHYEVNIDYFKKQPPKKCQNCQSKVKI